MKKIIITQFRQEPSGSTIGAHLYQFGINFHGNYAYSLSTTQEGMMYLQEALRKGNEVEFVQGWKEGQGS